MTKAHNPGGIAPPFSAYSHAVEVDPGARWLYVSGQVGIRPDGSVPEGLAAQCAQTWENIAAILGSAGMDVTDVVRINGYITVPDGMADYRAARDTAMKGHEPASTLLVIAALALPELLVEIEVVAAKAQ